MQILGLISDALLLAGTCGMAVWCRILTKRLKEFDDLDTGLGGTIAALSAQAEELKASIRAASEQTSDRGAALEEANARADDRIGRMEMLLASLEDIEAAAADHILEEPAPAPRDTVLSFRPSRPGEGGMEVRR